MKRMLLFIAVVVSSICAYSQTDAGYLDENTQTTATEWGMTDNATQNPQSIVMREDDYKHTPEWGKYKALRAVGWTSLGIGLPATAVGVFLAFASNSDMGSEGLATAAAITATTGAALTVASIPVLCVAYYYRHKAKRIGMNMGLTRLSAPSVGQNMSYTPAMSLTLTF